ncbi:MAG: hypothetical protein ACREXT_12810, partial [Gammaproteobacteria bacterium]
MKSPYGLLRAISPNVHTETTVAGKVTAETLPAPVVPGVVYVLAQDGIKSALRVRDSSARPKTMRGCPHPKPSDVTRRPPANHYWHTPGGTI